MHLAHEDGCDHNRARCQSHCIILKTAEPCSIKNECEQHDDRGKTDGSSATLVDVGAVSSGKPKGCCGKCKELGQCMSFRNTHSTNANLAVHEYLNGNNLGNDNCEPCSRSKHQHRYHGQLESMYEDAHDSPDEEASA